MVLLACLLFWCVALSVGSHPGDEHVMFPFSDTDNVVVQSRQVFRMLSLVESMRFPVVQGYTRSMYRSVMRRIT